MGHIRSDCPDLVNGKGYVQRSSLQPPYQPQRNQTYASQQSTPYTRTFSEYRAAKQGTTVLGKRGAEGQGTVMPYKNVRFDAGKETWPKKGPRPMSSLRAAATVAVDEEDWEFEEFQLKASQAFAEKQASEWEDYKVSRTVDVPNEDSYMQAQYEPADGEKSGEWA